jgi:hypothetical protein
MARARCRGARSQTRCAGVLARSLSGYHLTLAPRIGHPGASKSVLSIG